MRNLAFTSSIVCKICFYPDSRCYIYVLLLFPILLAVLLQLFKTRELLGILVHTTQGGSGDINTCLCFCCWRKQARSSGSSPFRVIMLSIWKISNKMSNNLFHPDSRGYLYSRGYLDSRGYLIFLALRSTSEMLGCLSLSCCNPLPLLSSSSLCAPCSWTRWFQKLKIRIEVEEFF